MDAPILILNLHPARFRFLAWFLERAGVRASAAESLEDGLRATGHERLRAVVVNSTVPARELRTTIRRLRDAFPGVPVVCYDCDDAGADLVIERPLSIDDVIDALAEGLAIPVRNWRD